MSERIELSTLPTVPAGQDVERTASGRTDGETDPLLLRSKVVPDQSVDDIRNRKGKKRSVNKKVAEFYEGQNEHIVSLLKPMEIHASEAAADEESSALKVKIAVRASFYANCILAVLQIYAAADSIFDPASNWVLNILHKKGQNADPVRWPQGGGRFSTIGNIVYGSLMSAVNLILIVESIRSLASHNSEEETLKLNVPSLIAVGIAFAFSSSTAGESEATAAKCRSSGRTTATMLFINGFGIFTSAAGAKIAWWLDPAGAILIATGVLIAWTRTIYAQFLLLAGISASPETLQLIIYKSMTFSPLIKQIDSCKAYHSGEELVVEVDVVMDPRTELWEAHDCAQALQDALEKMPGIDRAYVHVDHETDHSPEHSKKLA